MNSGLQETSLPGVPLFARGKVRDVYDLGERLLIVATDRISAFDCVLPTPVPQKGVILTQMSLFWLSMMSDILPNHLITADVAEYPADLRKYRDQLEGRSMLVRKARRIDVECVVRGYLAGSGWKDYQKTGMVCGHALLPGLRECDKLPEPIFTPATKEESGHDVNVSREHLVTLVGRELASELERLSLAVYERGRQYAEKRGIIIADTKFEFGWIDGRISLIDEIMSPDSSRFWPADTYQPGRAQDSFDKQYVRDYLETLDWDKTPPAPPLPADILAGTQAKYREAYERLVGKPFRPPEGA
ncbi:MAG: Phosphoribosylaminoimidazole-succinocarboxamide synthase [Candidatus Latescibacteria bacterium ADurb.Bin168]|nr:MAG: Phosphoribosylaminoimidazole-succinocarboxamide synthase [Candidatus Latescibacteria bacterium ADurb.Bin168]